MPKFTEKEKAVLNAIEGISFAEWIKISKAVNQTFEEMERARRNELKLADLGRVTQLIGYP